VPEYRSELSFTHTHSTLFISSAVPGNCLLSIVICVVMRSESEVFFLFSLVCVVLEEIDNVYKNE